MTVTDMTNYHQPFANFLLTCGYYLFLPLRFTDQFPFLAVSPTPLPSWGFTEAMPGGLPSPHSRSHSCGVACTDLAERICGAC